MKKIRNIVLILVSVFFLASCTATEWEEYPEQLVDDVSLYAYDKELDKYQLEVGIELPPEVYDEMTDSLVIQVRLYLKVICRNEETKAKQIYNNVPVDVFVSYVGLNDYYPYLDITEFQSDYPNSSISDISFQHSEFRIIVKTGTAIDNLPDGGMKVMQNIIYGMVFSFLVYIALVVVLGIIVNKKITKQQNKARDEFYKSYFNNK